MGAVTTCPHANPVTETDPDGVPIVLCPACGKVLTLDEVRASGIAVRDEEPSGFAHMPWPPPDGVQRRPYTPDEVELEIVDTLARIERGSIFLTQKERERGEAKLAHELAFARALLAAEGRSVQVREAEALIACRDGYRKWQTAELACRVSREALHNLRARLTGLQSVASSIRSSLEGAR